MVNSGGGGVFEGAYACCGCFGAAGGWSDAVCATIGDGDALEVAYACSGDGDVFGALEIPYALEIAYPCSGDAFGAAGGLSDTVCATSGDGDVFAGASASSPSFGAAGCWFDDMCAASWRKLPLMRRRDALGLNEEVANCVCASMLGWLAPAAMNDSREMQITVMAAALHRLGHIMANVRSDLIAL